MRNVAQDAHSEVCDHRGQQTWTTFTTAKVRAAFGASGGGRDLAQVMQRQLRDCRSLTATAAVIGQRGEL